MLLVQAMCGLVTFSLARLLHRTVSHFASLVYPVCMSSGLAIREWSCFESLTGRLSPELLLVLMFLGAHFVWAFSLMFLFSGRGYWQELIESIIWAHKVVVAAPAIYPRALSSAGYCSSMHPSTTAAHCTSSSRQLEWLQLQS